ncbi:MAG TPA: hypothetical protein VGA22_07760 [Gemmatimonadales bacterium]|jgi:hypothetical protein
MWDRTNQSDDQAHRRRALWILAPAVLLAAAAGLAVAGGWSGLTSNRVEATIPSGSTLLGALDHTISTESGRVGDAVEVVTVEPLRIQEHYVIPTGARLRGEITHVRGGGRLGGAPELTIRFTQLETDGGTYDIAAEPFRVRGKDDAGKTVAQIGGGAAAGGILGGVLGGGDDILKGAAVGAAIGTGVAVATKGDDIVLPAGLKLKVRLVEPVTVMAQRWEENGET